MDGEEQHLYIKNIDNNFIQKLYHFNVFWSWNIYDFREYVCSVEAFFASYIAVNVSANCIMFLQRPMFQIQHSKYMRNKYVDKYSDIDMAMVRSFKSNLYKYYFLFHKVCFLFYFKRSGFTWVKKTLNWNIIIIVQ